MARHVNWTPHKHPRLPNGQWAPKSGVSIKRARGRVRISANPRTYASRHRGSNINMHNVRVHGKPQTTKSARRKALNKAAAHLAVAAVVAGGTAAIASRYAKHTLSGGPNISLSQHTPATHRVVGLRMSPKYMMRPDVRKKRVAAWNKK